MCGGVLQVEENKSTVQCEFCSTVQTIPKIDNEKLLSLHNRANTLRLRNEFDKALMTYESIINENSLDAEAHWGILLCRYGIEYVDDPKTGKKIPTCHRTQYKSIFDDVDYQAAIENSDVIAKKMYQDEAEVINRIQKGILSISQKEEPFDVFICYKETDNSGKRTRDSVIAQQIYEDLTQKKYKVFFSRVTLESKLGTQYEPYIFAALNSAKIMLVIGTNPQYFNAVWVKNEWNRFLSVLSESKQQRYLIPCYRDMEAYDLPDELLSFQSQDMNKLGFIQDLVRGIDKIFDRKVNVAPIATPTAPLPTSNSNGGINIQALIKRSEILIRGGENAKASELLDEILNNDPENAKAYILLLLIELKLDNEEKLAAHSQPLTEYYSYNNAIEFADESYRSKLHQYNQEILEHIEYNRKKIIYDEAFEKEKAGSYKEAISIYSTIIDFEDSEKRIEACRLAIKEFFYSKAVGFQAKEQFDQAIENFQIVIDFKDSSSRIDQINSLIENQRRKIYERAIKAKEDYLFNDAIALFSRLGYYEDSIEQLKESNKLLTIEKNYYTAKQFANSNNIYNLERALNILKRFPEYRDSPVLIQHIKERISKINARNIYIKKRNKKVASLASIITLFIGVFSFLTVYLIVPTAHYQHAIKLYEKGSFREAVIYYEYLGDFGDSKNQIQVVKATEDFFVGDYASGIEHIFNINGTVNVVFNSNGGLSPIESMTLISNDVDIIPEKEHHSFIQWDLEYVQIMNNHKDTYIANLILKALWEEQ